MKKLINILLIVVLTMTMVLSAAASQPTLNEETGVTSISLLNCDERPGGANSFNIDKDEAQEGEACLSFNIGTGQVHEMQLPAIVNGEGYDTLEFDLYISDVTAIGKFADSGLELTSSGICDYQELSWTLPVLNQVNKGEALVNGWNHVILPLSTAREDEGTDKSSPNAGKFDITAINYMRLYMVGATDDTGAIMKVDNFRLSNYQAVIGVYKEAEEAAESINSRIEKLDEITAKNYKSMRTKIIGLRNQYKALDELAQSLVDPEMLALLTKYEEELAAFEANPPKEEQEEDKKEETPDEQKPDNDSEEQPKDGCSAMMGAGAFAVLVTTLSLGVVSCKKKEN